MQSAPAAQVRPEAWVGVPVPRWARGCVPSLDPAARGRHGEPGISVLTPVPSCLGSSRCIYMAPTPVGPRPGSLQPFPLESLEQLLSIPSPEILKVTLKGVTCKEVRRVGGFPSGSVVKNLRQCRKQAFDPGSARSPRDGNGNPLLYSCLENPMDRGGWQATVHGVPKESDTT